MRKKPLKQLLKEHPYYVKAAVIFLLTIIVFITIYLFDNTRNVDKNSSGQSILWRSEGGDDETQKMRIHVGNLKEDVEVSVSKEQYTDEELTEIFKEAAMELEEIILNENQSLDEVRTDLNLVTSLPEKNLLIAWKIDNYEIMDIRGKIHEEAVTSEGTIIKLTAIMSYGERKAGHEFYARIFPPKLDKRGEILQELETKMKESDDETKTEKYMVLPDMINGKNVEWRYEENTRAYGILILGFGLAILIIVSNIQKSKEEEKLKIRQMKIEYPQIINKFNLYIRAGMTIRKAWFKISQEYETRAKNKDQKKCHAFEEMVYTMHRIQGGASEGECYEEFGTRCGISEYRKFGMMLSQNLRKGTKGLTELLGRESEDAFEERKKHAKKLGEEAGTKLMIPLFMMLIIVFVIVIVPAFLSVQL